jgi:shikimate kinase
MEGWILVGMMGSGKSSVGRSLAAQSGREFLDTDQLLQHRVARPIKQFFAVYGEDAFRELETRVIQEQQPGLFVLATGGGIVLRDVNWKELKRIGKIVYLRATAETLCKRLVVTRHRRPLLQSDDWESKLANLVVEREPVYMKADIVIDVDDLGIEDAVQAILAKVGQEP